MQTNIRLFFAIVLASLLGVAFTPRASSAAEKCSSGCNTVSMIFIKSPPVFSIQHLMIGLGQREFKVYQGGTIVLYDVHNCLCNQGISCKYVHTQTDDPNDQDSIGIVDSGCAFLMGPNQTVPSASDCQLVGTQGC